MDKLYNLFSEPFREQQRDRVYHASVTIVFTLVSFILLISAIVIWPIVFNLSNATAEASLAAGLVRAADGIILAGVITAALSLFISLAMPDAAYSFIKLMFISFIAGFVICLIMLFSRPITIAGVDDTAFALIFMRIVANLTLSVILSIVPALAGCVAGALVRAAHTLIFSQK